jgi:hypothetical protein
VSRDRPSVPSRKEEGRPDQPAKPRNDSYDGQAGDLVEGGAGDDTENVGPILSARAVERLMLRLDWPVASAVSVAKALLPRLLKLGQLVPLPSILGGTP